MRASVKDKKYLIAYHANCLDGITAAAVMYRALVDTYKAAAGNIDTIAVDYNTGYTELCNKLTAEPVNTLYIVDFSFKRAELLEIYELVDSIYLYDHHKTAFQNLISSDYKVYQDSVETLILSTKVGDTNKLLDIYVYLNNSESGASLVWKMHNGKWDDKHLPRLVAYVKDYDLTGGCGCRYTWTPFVNRWLKLQEKTLSTFLPLLWTFENIDESNKIVEIGSTIFKYENSIENNIIANCTTPVTINGIKGLCCNAPYAFASSIGHKLAERSGTFGAVWVQQKDGVINWSLRSIGDSCDVSELAAILGGGGHKNAAGFSMHAGQSDVIFNIMKEGEEKSNDRS